MTVNARAPVRIDFAGGWSDVPIYADEHGGSVLNAAIGLYARVECTPGGGRFRIHAEDIGERVSVGTPAKLVYDGKLDLHKAAINMLPVLGGVEIISNSDVPAGSGLGASGSLDVALLAALAACREETYPSTELAEMGYALEAEELGMLGGRQDQYAAAVGGFNHLRFGKEHIDAKKLSVSADAAAELEQCTEVVYTGQSHFSSETHERVWNAYQSGLAEVTDAIHTMRDLVNPATDALMAGQWRALAALIDENWRQQQRLDATISTEGTKRIETAARAAGAWGVKAAGSGAGGCLVIIGDPATALERERTVTDAGGQVLAWQFDFDGVTTW